MALPLPCNQPMAVATPRGSKLQSMAEGLLAIAKQDLDNSALSNMAAQAQLQASRVHDVAPLYMKARGMVR
jgi:hypothetical protein